MVDSCKHCCTRIENLGVRFGENSVLEGVHLHINCGELMAVIGPNGAGKTTLLRAILGEIPYTGTMSFQVEARSRKNPKIGYVPQRLDFDASSPISVSDFIATSVSRRPVWSGISGHLKNDVDGILANFSAAHLAKRRMGTLSGGELQRVLLAMAMTPPPSLLLLDEPVSGVDANGLSLFYQIASSLRKKYDVSIILVTHDLAGIARHADRMILLNRTIIAEGKPHEVLSNEKLVRTFGPSLWNISQLPDLKVPP